MVLKRSNASDRCGFFRINRESVVPYTLKDSVKYVPLFYFEGETDHLKLKSDKVDGWDLAYLKFCCKVQGIRNELFAADTCRVVALDEIKGHFPSGTTFEDYWPAKGSIEPVQHTQRVSAGNWTQKPVSVVPQSQQQQAAPPPAHQRPSVASAVSQHSSSVSNNSAALNSQYNQYAQQLAAAAAAAQLSTAAQRAYGDQVMQQMMRASAQAQVSSNAAQAQLLQQQQRMLAAAYGMSSNPMLNSQQTAASARSVQQAPSSDKQFNGKLTQIKEFPMEQSHQPPYKLQKALIDQKIVPCINVRPYVFHDLMMTLPDFVKHFYPELTIEKARQMLQDILKVVLYKGNRYVNYVLLGFVTSSNANSKHSNLESPFFLFSFFFFYAHHKLVIFLFNFLSSFFSGHQEILRSEGKCTKYDPVPLVLVKDIMNYMPQMKYMFQNVAAPSSSDPSAKRQRLS